MEIYTTLILKGLETYIPHFQKQFQKVTEPAFIHGSYLLLCQELTGFFLRKSAKLVQIF